MLIHVTDSKICTFKVFFVRQSDVCLSIFALLIGLLEIANTNVKVRHSESVDLI